MKNIKIFCDFDGTITETDNIESIMKNFAPEKSKPIIEKIFAKKITIKNGIEQMFQLIPSSKKQEIINYLLEHAIIRAGFQDFVAFTNEKNIPLYIVSGGIDFFVEPMLAPFVPLENIYCNHSDFSKEFIQIHYPYPCDSLCNNFETQACGCCKPSIMRKHVDAKVFSIVIGDSITDFEAAKHADLIFARDRLQKKCEELQMDFVPFTTFTDCIEALQQVLEEIK